MNMFTAAEAVKNYGDAGAKKASMPIWKLFVLGILAGALIALAAVTANTAAHALDNVSTIKTVSGLLFPFGLAIVILSGSELFTGNNLIIISVLEKKTTLVRMLRNWVAVYLGNFVGSVLIALMCVYFGQLELSAGGLGAYTIKLAAGKCLMPFGNALVMGILCNVLVCLAVFLSLSAKDVTGRILGAFLPVAFFIICGFEHSVANMYYVPAGIFAMDVPKYAALAAEMGVNTSILNWGGFILNNLLPVTIGNIIGGAGIGAVLWACHVRPSAEKPAAK